MKLIKDLGMREYGKQGLKKRICLYECPKCLKHFEARKENVKSGKSTQCRSCSVTKHGLRNTKIYNVWSEMVARTSNPNHHDFKNYGGRGILLCDEWKKEFKCFYDWSIVNGYSKNLSIDRVNNDGNYEPSNCRWATAKQQANNRRVRIKDNQ